MKRDIEMKRGSMRHKNKENEETYSLSILFYRQVEFLNVQEVSKETNLSKESKESRLESEQEIIVDEAVKVDDAAKILAELEDIINTAE